MGSRLEETSHEVTWTESRKITVGYHTCPFCGVETPTPSMSDMIKFAKMRPNGGYMWPGDGRDGWTPPGWTIEYEEGLICPDCTAAKRTALMARRKKS